VGAAFAIPLVLSAGLDLGSGLIDWLAAAMICAAVAAIVPLPRSIARRVGLRAVLREPAGSASAPAGPPNAAASGASISVVATPVPDPGPAPRDAVAAAAPESGSGDGPVVAVTDVTKRYGGVRALDGVSLTIGEGELVGLVGPNGSGKSTLVGLIAGTIRPTSGEIAIAGRSTGGVPPHRIAHLGVARTYQIPRPFGSMSVRDNVAVALMFGRERHGLEAARREADQYIELVGLLGRAGSRPAEINLHERQLLEMARALATRPRILLLDEALAGLNPLEVEQAVGVVRRIHDSGVTIIIVEHLLRVVNQLATRIVVLEQGRTLAAGAPAVVMRDPAVVRAYLGTHADA
jgi:branched-chain amino acid transport system permease protein